MGADDEQGIHVLIPMEQDSIPFYGHELVAVRLEDGRIAAVLRWLCEGMRLNQQSQLRSIRGRMALAQGLVDVRVQTEGGPQAMPALTLKVLPGWLFSVDERRVREEARDDLVHFHLECVDVLAEHFARKQQLALPAPADPTGAAIIEQIADLTAVTTLLREHLAALLTLPGQVHMLAEQVGRVADVVETLAERQGTTEAQVAQLEVRTDHLTPAHAQQVQDLVNRLVRETKRLPAPLTHAIIYGRIRHHFRVNSYTEMRDGQFEDLLAWLRDELTRATSGEAPQQRGLF
jgi:P22_AR N-terminal domain